MMDARSEARLAEVHPDLASVVREAFTIMPVDGVSFVVTEGARTQARQRELVASGASLTMHSRHLTGHAVDLAATIGGPTRIQWKLELYYRLALAMREAALRSDMLSKIVWGGCWKPLAELGQTEDAIAQAVSDYGARARAAGQKSLVDGPHFELARAAYP